MKSKLRKVISQYKTEVRELQKLPDQCKKEVNPVCHGSLMQLKNIILDLEELLSVPRRETKKVRINKQTKEDCIHGFLAKSHYCFECDKEDICNLPD